ncbi:gluconolactonase [Komagataeibacter medellinensis]|uniref:Gluconolactonase n=1 Tax=Komagataeibacter medellinensis TaxID=1177712 RepID=A0ABQ6VU34_9PROT|nr:gluconolactonase [Komagataeibacter medellinensis]
MPTLRPRWRPWRAMLAVSLLSCAAPLRHAMAQHADKLHVALTSERVLNAVAIADDGRRFVSFPYWGGGGSSGPTVAEIDASGQTHAFPDARWNHPDGTKGMLQPFVRVNAIRIGPDGLLWVVDSGDANVGGPPSSTGGAPARLLAFDIMTGAVVHALSLHAASTPHSYMDDIRFHNDTIFVTDAGDPALVVVNLTTGAQRRVLAHDRSTTDERPMYAEGKLLRVHGQPARIHADQLEVSPDGQILYFQPSSGPMWTVPTAALENPALPATDLARAVNLFYNTPSSGGSAIDGDGNLYVSDVDRLRILRITPQGKASTLIHDKRLVWADAMWIDSHGVLWIPAVQLNRTATFQSDDVSRVRLPVAIYTMDLHLKPVR